MLDLGTREVDNGELFDHLMRHGRQKNRFENSVIDTSLLPPPFLLATILDTFAVTPERHPGLGKRGVSRIRPQPLLNAVGLAVDHVAVAAGDLL